MNFLFGRGKEPANKKPALPPPSSEQVSEALKNVIDPDLKKDIVSLGFVKDIQIDPKNSNIAVTVQLTTPACPVKDLLKSQCEKEIRKAIGNSHYSVDITMTANVVDSSVVIDAMTKASIGGIKNIVAVASGKGGVGKSTVSALLAASLNNIGCKVGVLDADIYGPSMPIISKAAAPKIDSEKFILPPVVDGIKVLSIGLFPGKEEQANIFRGPMIANIFKSFVTQVKWGELDYLIIDLPPGTGDIQLSLSQMMKITGAVFVTSPSELSEVDVQKAIKMFQTMKVKSLGIIENMSYFLCGNCDTKHNIFNDNQNNRESAAERLSKAFNIPLLGKLPLNAASDYAEGISSMTGSVFAQNLENSAFHKEIFQISKNLAAEISKSSHGAEQSFTGI